MSRFPPIPPSQQTPEQKQTQNQLESQGTVFGGEGITRTDSDGTMQGPFVPLLYTPSICRPLLSFIPVIVNLPHLTPRVRELAILATANSETWDQARSCLGIEGVANLAHVVGAYAHMCLYQNAADIDWHGGYQM